MTLNTSGSYRLASDLNVTVATTPENISGIDINAHHVTIDLNGFSIIGPGELGTGDGIDARFFNSIVVLNGNVRWMGGDGVRTGSLGRIEGVHVEGNGLDGIFATADSVVTRCAVNGNGGIGITANTSVIRNNVAISNGSFGIDGGNSSTIVGNSARSNTGSGIKARWGSTVTSNSARLNSASGLDLAGGFGSGYAGNTINENTSGTVTGGVEMGANVRDWNTTCP